MVSNVKPEDGIEGRNIWERLNNKLFVSHNCINMLVVLLDVNEYYTVRILLGVKEAGA